MSDVIIDLFNISIMASWLIFIIILLRLTFIAMPKKILRYLWLVVGLRLMLPFSLETSLSLIPSSKTILAPNDSILMIHTGFGMIDDNVNLILENNVASQIDIVSIFHLFINIAFIVWIIGLSIILIYGFISYRRVHKLIEVSVNHHDNVYICDDIDTPFIFGYLEPKIYLPSNIDENQMNYILEHEKIHIEHKDHIWKPLGYLLLSIYWFNPLIWIAYILLCRDIESACDERVIEKIGEQSKSEYSETLLYCSTNKKILFACPVAFGEVRVKERIQDILNYCQPKIWVKRVSLLICIVLSVGFLTNPFSLENVVIPDYESSMYTNEEIEAGIKTVYRTIKYNFIGCTPVRIEYGGDGKSIIYNEWAQRYNANEVMVFYADFEVDSRAGGGPLNPNSTYKNYNFILVRRLGGRWSFVDGGYG